MVSHRPEAAGVSLLSTMTSNTRWLRRQEQKAARILTREGARVGLASPAGVLAISARARSAVAALDRSIKVVAQSSGDKWRL